MTSFTFHKGSRYLFTANNISGSHPFMIGSSNGVNSPIVNGGPLTTNGHQIIVDIPQNFSSTLVYYCTNGSMLQTMNIADPPQVDISLPAEATKARRLPKPGGGYQIGGGNQSPGGGYQSPGGGYTSPGSGFVPVYDLNTTQ